MKKKGIYIVTETIIPNTGASLHVSHGLKELNKVFDIELLHLSPQIQVTDSKANSVNSTPTPSQKFSRIRKTGIVGLFRDIFLLIKNHKYIYRDYNQIKSLKPDFLYIRSSYLNFSGILISKLLGISAFYEINGLQYLACKDYYSTYFLPFAKLLELFFYNRANFCFCIENSGDMMKLKKGRWMHISNGVEPYFISKFEGNEKNEGEGKIQVCHSGHFMPHYRSIDVVNSLNQIKNKSQIFLHLLGTNLAGTIKHLSEDIQYEYMGHINHSDMPNYLKKIHVAIIPPGIIYQPVRIFEYGAARCLVIAPSVPSLTHVFSDEEVIYYNPDISSDLKTKIEYVIENPLLIELYGKRLHDKILHNFTWELVYQKVIERIFLNI